MFVDSGSSEELAPRASLRLSVVMPTLNRRKVLSRAIESIFRQDLPSGQYEVIAVVDGSDGKKIEHLKSLRPACALRIVEQPNKNLAVALNQGIATARGDLVLFVDDDLVLHPSNLRRHLEAHATDDSLIVHGPVYVAEGSTVTIATDWIKECVNEEIKGCEKGWIWPEDADVGANYSIPRTALLASGGYDEEFRWRQGRELGVRLVNMGLEVVYEPNAAASRIHSKTSEQLLHIQVRSRGREEMALLQKHPELRRCSALARIGEGSAWSRFAIQLAARSPVSPEILLRPVSALLERARFSSLMRRLGRYVLRKRITIAFLRGALDTATWNDMQCNLWKRLPVLLYHHVGPPNPNFDRLWTIPARKFEEHIRFLARQGYVGIRASDWLAWVRDGKSLPEKPILLTFDDAFEDLEDHAFPVLAHYGFGGLVFVVTNCVGKANIWDKSRGFELLRCLTAEQIQCWSAKGIEFGAHSKNHPDLTKIAEPELDEEMSGSRLELENIVREPVTTFAYPYGRYDTRAIACAARFFDLSFTTEDGLNTLRTDASLLHRNIVYAWDTLLDLEFLVRLGWNPVRSLNRSFRKRFRFLKFVRKKLFQNKQRDAS